MHNSQSPIEAQSAPTTKSKPILFSAPMVRALLAGTKTQTRRITKPQPEGVSTFEGETLPYWHVGGFRTHLTANKKLICPYGATGDHLWVREHFRLETLLEDLPPSAAGAKDTVRYETDSFVRGEQIDDFGRLRVGMFMPRWASRITLRITDVRVERLNAISEADAEAEGIDGNDALVGQIANPYRTAYAQLWESINGVGSWSVDPFVWVVAFEVVKSGA